LPVVGIGQLDVVVDLPAAARGRDHRSPEVFRVY
jgi:hypothetical protein